MNRDDWKLWEWDWGIPLNGTRLHHAASIELDEGGTNETQGHAVTSCGRKLWLNIPGMFSRMGARRCSRCCDALGYPRGIGSPKNDNACRPLVEARFADSLDLADPHPERQ